jgi:hypothetical protein
MASNVVDRHRIVEMDLTNLTELDLIGASPIGDSVLAMKKS